MPTAYLNIGSNKGDRLALIEKAVALIEHLCGHTARKSPVVRSRAWGYDSDSEFLNMGIAIYTDLSPMSLLDSLQDIEHTISPTPHRDDNDNYIDRDIDIDIIAIDNLVIDSPRLTLPHRHMHRRDFVLTPMIYLNPDWKHPILNATPAEMRSMLKPTADFD